MNAAPLSPPAAVSPRDSVPAECRLPTRHGDFVLHGFRDPDDGKEHVALTLGTVNDGTPVLTRIHSECLTGDVFGSLRCDCGEQLDAALERIAAEGRGVLLYLRQEGRGIGLVNKIRAYRLQEEGADTVEANHMLGFAGDLRQYAIARRMLDALGVRHVRLMTNNPLKIEALDVLGVDVVQRVPLAVPANRHNERYLRTKSERMRHLLPRAARPAAHADDGGES